MREGIYFYANEVMPSTAAEHSRQAPVSLEENLKKATTELLILQLLSKKEYYIGELSAALHDQSGGTLAIVFPYAAIYRLLEAGYIMELPRRIAPDGRRRQYFAITKTGVAYLQQLREIYTAFSAGVAQILEHGVTPDE